MGTGGGGGGGGTYGSPTSGDLPGTSNTSKDPLALTGMTQGQLSSGTLGVGAFNNSAPMPTDNIFIGAAALGRPVGTRGHDPHRYSGFTTYQDAQSLPGTWYSNDPNRYKQLVSKLIMYKYPGASADMGIPEVMSAWDDLLKMAITLNKSQGKNLKTNWTPWDILESYNRKPGSLGTTRQGDWLIDNATGEKVKYVGPKTKTSKQSVLDLSDAEQVQAIASQALTQMIGRAPTAKELAQFKATLNGYEREHPEITTSTDHYDDMGNVTATDVVRSGGVEDAARASLIGKKVQGTKEYGKYQSGTTYFNALMQMVGGG
jgi:hypothetical protein